MSPFRIRAAAIAALALFAVALPARAQPAKPAADSDTRVQPEQIRTPPASRPGVKPAADSDARVHRMEIWNGPRRSVHYFSQGYSQGEESALRDLGRAENALAVEDDVEDLRRLYLQNERLLEQRRGEVNPLLYGYSSEYAAGLFPGAVPGGFGYGNFAGYPYGVGGYGNIAGTFGYLGGNASLGTVSNSLANGVGNEGVIKNVLAQGLAAATTPDATRTSRAYDAAVARVAESDRLRAGLGWGKGPIATVGHERTVGGPVTVTAKDGKTYEGTLVQEDSDWVTVETATDEVSLRKTDVTRIVRPKKPMKPAP